ncbi:GNAT family N-acetyltransferase [Nocardia sp. 348MFTsu5.1]|uniref:GNAT family N-acetyltransferase n=1 Tax=Nocardia sp. 348MFTsu5.1 TaxID=1172185 RepID=UPI00036A8886|nr:GNAT family N-acetyltransferase [Nocardia sp. 348MFTsu5.1]
MSAEIRVLEHPMESGQALRVFGRAMIGLAGINQLDPEHVLEPGRFLGAVESGTVVAGADSYTSWLAVPGGNRVPHAAVTHVGVLPTHRRRGLVRALITAQLKDFARRGEVVASLRASEATIYGRFGYAVASSAASIEILSARAALLPTVTDPGPVRLIDDSAGGGSLTRTIYSEARWVGAVDRPDGWWNLRDMQREKQTTPSYLVVFDEDGAETGYARYQPADPAHWFTSDRREVVVGDFVANTDNAYLALVRHLLSLDLVDVITFASRPLDDPLPALMSDPRGARVRMVGDETWLRIVDVQAALSARTYRSAAPVAISVTDALLPANNATFEVGPETVRRVDTSPDLTVDVAGLAAIYLGGTTWQHLTLAGTAIPHTNAAVERADNLFGTARLPHSGTVF